MNNNNNRLEWKNAWDVCTNLRAIEVNYCTAGHLEPVMAVPKDHIKVLKICMLAGTGGDEVKKMMDICSKATKGVESLSINGPRDDLDQFLENNRNTLVSITMYKKYDYHRRDEKLDKLIEAFLELPALEELRIDCIISEHFRAALQESGVYVAIPR